MPRKDKTAYREGTTPGGRKYDVEVDKKGRRSVNVYGSTFGGTFTNSKKEPGVRSSKALIGVKSRAIGRGPTKPLNGGTKVSERYKQPSPGKTMRPGGKK